MFERISPTRYTLLDDQPLGCLKRLLQSERNRSVRQLERIMVTSSASMRALRMASKFSARTLPVMARYAYLFKRDHGDVRVFYV